MACDEVVFNGERYKFNKTTGYYIFYDKKYENRTGKTLHRAVWEFYSGKKIPKGYVIHHIDGNRGNNDYSNLMCLSPAEHAKIHKWNESTRKWLQEHPEKTQDFIEKARAWHKSEEGRKKASETSKANMDKVRETRTCVLCGRQFDYCVTKNSDDRKVCYKCKDCWKHKAVRRGLHNKDWKRCLCSELKISL